MVSSSETEGVIKTLLIKTNHRTIALKSNLSFSKKTLKCQKKKSPNNVRRPVSFFLFFFFNRVKRRIIVFLKTELIVAPERWVRSRVRQTHRVEILSF